MEDIAKDNCTDYLIVCCDCGKIYTAFNSQISAVGMSTMVIDDVHAIWARSRENGEQE